MADAKC